MASRGAKSGIVQYEPYKRGQITKYEAGVIYKAVKTGKITAKPETTRELYAATDAYIRFADERYNQNYIQYDRIYRVTEYVLNKKYKKAQEMLNDWEENNISRATKKSPWYKYRSDNK